MKYFWTDSKHNILIKISRQNSIMSYTPIKIIFESNIIYSITSLSNKIRIKNIKCRYYPAEFESNSVIELLQSVINDIKIINQHNTDNNYMNKITELDESNFLANLYNMLSSNNMINDSVKNELNYADFNDYINYKSNKITDKDYFFPK